MWKLKCSKGNWGGGEQDKKKEKQQGKKSTRQTPRRVVHRSGFVPLYLLSLFYGLGHSPTISIHKITDYNIMKQ